MKGQKYEGDDVMLACIKAVAAHDITFKSFMKQ